jgi:hypothetical protein
MPVNITILSAKLTFYSNPKLMNGYLAIANLEAYIVMLTQRAGSNRNKPRAEAFLLNF